MSFIIYSILFGLILPWIGGYFLYLKDKYLILTVAPIASVVSYTTNTLGDHYDFWHYQPFALGDFAILPLNLGYFALAGTLIVYLIQRQKINPYLILLFASTFLTICEFLAITGGLLIYGQNWNYLYTLLSYFFAYTLVYWYYLQLSKLRI